METNQFYLEHKNKQYLFPPLPEGTVHEQANWIMFQSGVPFVPLDIAGPWDKMLAEVQAVDSEFIEHRSDGAGWSSMCLHGLSIQQTMSANSYPEYANTPDEQVPYQWTELAVRCPIATEYFKTQFPWKSYSRLRYMRLAPGGFIPPHVDGTSHRLVVVNISLNNPNGCDMVLENVGIVPFNSSGGAMAFNNSHRHIVVNRSDEPRYHMIVHGIWNNQYNYDLVRSYRNLVK